MIIEIDIFFIKEILYKYYNNDNRVDIVYNKLSEECKKQTKNIDKNIAFYLTELSILNYEYNLEKYKFLYIWKKEYTDKILDHFKLSYKSVKKLLQLYNNLSNVFLNVINNQKNMYTLQKDEYIYIHQMFNKQIDMSYYYEGKNFFYKKVFKLEDVKYIDDKYIIRIFNYSNPVFNKYYDVATLVEYKSYINKIIYKINNLKVKICKCNNPHNNSNVIDVNIDDMISIYYKINKNEKNILECYDNELLYDFFMHISKIDYI